MKNALLMAGLLGAGLSATSASAAVLISDDFSYSNGAITTVSGGSWVLHSGTEGASTSLNIASGQAVINQGDTHSNGVDVNRLFAGPTTFDPATDNTSKLYSSFTVNFSQLPVNGDSEGSYFAHFKSSAANEFYGRIGANTAGAAAGSFRIALANEAWSAAASIEFPQDLSLGTTYTIVSRLDLATDQTTLWINPADETSASITATDVIGYAAGAINAYALRQGTSGTGAPGILAIDGLRVGTSFAEVVPEPTSLGLLGLGLGGLAFHRRRRGA